MESSSDFEISSTYSPELPNPFEHKTVLMDGQNLLMGPPAGWLSYLVPVSSLAPLFSSVNLSELEEKKRVEAPVEGKGIFVFLWKEKKEDRVKVEWNFEEREKCPILPPRMYLLEGMLAQVPCVRSYTGEAEFSPDGKLQSTKIKVRITEEKRGEKKPTSAPPAPEKKPEEKPKVIESAPEEKKPEEKPKTAEPAPEEEKPKKEPETAEPTPEEKQEPTEPTAPSEEKKPEEAPQPPPTAPPTPTEEKKDSPPPSLPPSAPAPATPVEKEPGKKPQPSTPPTPGKPPSAPAPAPKEEPMMGFTYEFIGDYSITLLPPPPPGSEDEQKDVSVSRN